MLLVVAAGVHAQDPTALLVKNDSLSEAIKLQQGVKIKIRYQGYLGQETFITGVIQRFDQESVTLGAALDRSDTTRILIKDITGLRVFTIGWQIARVSTQTVLIGANIALYVMVLAPSPMAPLARFIVSGLGGGISLLATRLLFHERIKYKKEEGWTFLII